MLNSQTCLTHHKNNMLNLASAIVVLLGVVAQANKEVVTNQFHVRIRRDASGDHAFHRAIADNIAKENGFHNLGPVSTYE